MIGLMLVLLTFFRMVSMVLVLWGVMLLGGLEGCYSKEFKEKIMLHCLREVKRQQGFTTGFDIRYIMF